MNRKYLDAAYTLVETLNELLGSSSKDVLTTPTYGNIPNFQIKEHKQECCGGAIMTLLYTTIKDTHMFSIPIVRYKVAIRKEYKDIDYEQLSKLFYYEILRFVCNLESFRVRGLPDIPIATITTNARQE
jgi:hypothetical protein